MSIRKDDKEELQKLKDLELKISLFTPVQNTEDPQKVIKAVQTLFPIFELVNEGDQISGRTENPLTLLHFADSIRTHQNLDSSRKIMRKSFVDDIIRLDFDKQAALKDRFHFCNPNEAPLGTIVLQIIILDPEVLIDILAPKWEWIKPIKPKRRRF